MSVYSTFKVRCDTAQNMGTPHCILNTEILFASLFLAENTLHWTFLHCTGQCLLSLLSSLFSWLENWVCLPCHVVWGWGMLPTSSIRLLTNVSLDCWCDGFEPRKARMIKLYWPDLIGVPHFQTLHLSSITVAGVVVIEGLTHHLPLPNTQYIQPLNSPKVCKFWFQTFCVSSVHTFWKWLYL